MAGETERLPDQPRPDRRNAFILLFFALMAIGAGNTMLLAAVLPQLTREMAMPDWMAGAVFSLSALLWSITEARYSADLGCICNITLTAMIC